MSPVLFSMNQQYKQSVHMVCVEREEGCISHNSLPVTETCNTRNVTGSRNAVWIYLIRECTVHLRISTISGFKWSQKQFFIDNGWMQASSL